MGYIKVADATSFVLLVWLGLTLALSGLSLWLAIPATPYHLVAGLVLTVYAFILTQYERRTITLALIVSASIVIFCTYIAGLVYDLSYDGQVYHIPAIVALATGWNPLQHDTLSGWNPVYAEAAGADIFIEHYAKGAWYLAASVYKATGNIEHGKGINLLLTFVTFATGIGALQRLGLSMTWSLGIALAAALNPVAIYQASTFYVDGQLASLFTILVFLSISFLHEPKREFLLPLLSALLLLIELKFTGLVYSTLLVIAVIVAAWLHKGRSVALRYALATGALATLAIGVIGYHPYITNTINNGHPFYPALGSESGRNIQWGQAPDEFMQQDRISKLFLSILSHSSNLYPKYKPPFKISNSDLLSLTYADTRYAGFGPLFSGVLILSILPLLTLPYTFSRAALFYISLAFATLAATLLINPEAWWARLAPQFWLMPLLAITVIALGSKHSIKLWLARLILALMLINSSLILLYNIRYSHARTSEMAAMLDRLYHASTIQPVDIIISNGFKVIMSIRLADRHIRYQQSQTLECNPTHSYTHIFKTCAL